MKNVYLNTPEGYKIPFLVFSQNEIEIGKPTDADYDAARIKLAEEDKRDAARRATFASAYNPQI